MISSGDFYAFSSLINSAFSQYVKEGSASTPSLFVYLTPSFSSSKPQVHHPFLEKISWNPYPLMFSKHYEHLHVCFFSSVQSVVPDSLWPHGLQHARPSCLSPIPRVYPNSCPLNQWCHPTISSSVIPFSCLQSFPASGSFQMSQLCMSGGQNIGVSASTSVLPVNIQDWFPLGWTGWISLQSKGLSRVFSNTTVQKHQFFGAQLSV